MTESIVDISRRFFEQVVKPILAECFPEVLAHAAIGVVGYGSEVLRLDDAYSSDHHWGLRVDTLLPHELFVVHADEIKRVVGAGLPAEFEGHALRTGHVDGAGVAPESLRDFLLRTIGIDHAPRNHVEWLKLPEEDIIHVTNGEIWHDPSGNFSRLRTALQAYYPEPVRQRRIAHWCRYFSGMGTYALRRAILRDNEYYANIAFTRALRLGVQLAFLLDKTYFPYDKWTYAHFVNLPRLAQPLKPLVDEAARLATPWERKLELLHNLSDVLDATMVADGLIRPHPRFQVSPTSGYRLLGTCLCRDHPGSSG